MASCKLRVTDDITARIVTDPAFDATLTSGLAAGINDIIQLDMNASWDGQRIVGSCVLTHTCKQYDSSGDQELFVPSATISPRVIVLPIFNPSHTADTTVVNFLALFITRFNAVTNEVEGVLVGHPGQIDNSVKQVPLEAAFLRTIQLVR